MSPQLKDITKYLGLFTSMGTLLCCAIPSTLVLLGFGTSLASFIDNFPQLIWLSENKGIVFGLSFIMLGVAFYFQRTQVCPLDQREACQGLKRWSHPILMITLIINLIGVIYAFVLPRIL